MKNRPNTTQMNYEKNPTEVLEPWWFLIIFNFAWYQSEFKTNHSKFLFIHRIHSIVSSNSIIIRYITVLNWISICFWKRLLEILTSLRIYIERLLNSNLLIWWLIFFMLLRDLKNSLICLLYFLHIWSDLNILRRVKWNWTYLFSHTIMNKLRYSWLSCWF